VKKAEVVEGGTAGFLQKMGNMVGEPRMENPQIDPTLE